MPEPAVGEAGVQRRQEQAKLTVPRPGRASGRAGDCVLWLPNPEASLPITPRVRMQSPVAPDRAETRHAEAENHRAVRPKGLESCRRARALGSSGAGHTGRACSPEPGSARETGAGSSEWTFSSARAARRGGANTRLEAAAGQVLEPSVPSPGTAVICAPHRTQLWCAPPALPRPSKRRAGLRPAAGSGVELPRAPPLPTLPNPTGVWPKLTDFRPINRQKTEARVLGLILPICPHLRPPHLPPALPRREPRLVGRVQRTARLQDKD